MEERLQREIDHIWQSEELSEEQKREEVRRLEDEYRHAAEEAAHRAYDEELSRW